MMHEVSIMADLMAAIKKELERYDVISVKEVTLTLGRLTNLGCEQMEFAYEIMSRDSILDGSKLVIEEEDVRVRCEDCGYEGPAGNLSIDEDVHCQIPILSCPVCGAAVKVIAGKTCCVKSIEIEEAD
ncbi:MAG: hydrogenase maturation nickel metallochaperone HypA [Candidatus Methanoplasma sp.]|jgi:hydrogenase nickel incorporation protein HypA/HybF|nr:hydrogenase maturation nickel metallochaperone HypA [Candidatus Methanoplasma sp.]